MERRSSDDSSRGPRLTMKDCRRIRRALSAIDNKKYCTLEDGRTVDLENYTIPLEASFDLSHENSILFKNKRVLPDDYSDKQKVILELFVDWKSCRFKSRGTKKNMIHTIDDSIALDSSFLQSKEMDTIMDNIIEIVSRTGKKESTSARASNNVQIEALEKDVEALDDKCMGLQKDMEVGFEEAQYSFELYVDDVKDIESRVEETEENIESCKEDLKLLKAEQEKSFNCLEAYQDKTDGRVEDLEDRFDELHEIVSDAIDLRANGTAQTVDMLCNDSEQSRERMDKIAEELEELKKQVVEYIEQVQKCEAIPKEESKDCLAKMAIRIEVLEKANNKKTVPKLEENNEEELATTKPEDELKKKLKKLEDKYEEKFIMLKDEFKKELKILITTTELLGDNDVDNKENQSEPICSGPNTSMAEITNSLGRFESA